MDQNLLSLPKNIAQMALESGDLRACHLLSTYKFVDFCKARGVAITKSRLLRLEKFKLFTPLFRIKNSEKAKLPINIPIPKNFPGFEEGWVWDTMDLNSTYPIPEKNDEDQEAFYSAFQIDHLNVVLSSMNITIHMDEFFDDLASAENWSALGKSLMKHADQIKEVFANHEHRRSVGLLCQCISDRYYFETQTDQRFMRYSTGGSFSNAWITMNYHNWDWFSYSRHWNPKEDEKLFHLSPEKLEHAYETLAISQASCDPLERWYKLVQFISVEERSKLGSHSLRAETIRSGAQMLGMLYRDLYGKELPHPNEVTGTIIRHIPEKNIRKDTRRYLEYVVNQYHLNPQPKATLFVEGKSEENTIKAIFDQYFGADPGTYHIEIVNLWGVDTATGGKEDKFRAILRLIDYLHYHQTFTFLILDNENYAKRIKNESKKAKSIHHNKRYVTRPEYIKIWKNSFEFDNYSCTEIAKALSQLSKGRVKLKRDEILVCKKMANPGIELSEIYKKKTGYNLNKVEFNEALSNAIFENKDRRNIENRPIIQTLNRVIKLAMRNHFPTMHEVWESNQSSRYLGKRR